MGLLDSTMKAVAAFAAGSQFGGLTGTDSGKEPWWTDSWESLEKLCRRKVASPRPKFCIHCGSFIPDPDIRKMHIELDHLGVNTSECEFCIICGDHIGPEGNKRVDHYRENHSLVKARQNA